MLKLNSYCTRMQCRRRGVLDPLDNPFGATGPERPRARSRHFAEDFEFAEDGVYAPDTSGLVGSSIFEHRTRNGANVRLGRRRGQGETLAPGGDHVAARRRLLSGADPYSRASGHRGSQQFSLPHGAPAAENCLQNITWIRKNTCSFRALISTFEQRWRMSLVGGRFQSCSSKFTMEIITCGRTGP